MTVSADTLVDVFYEVDDPARRSIHALSVPLASITDDADELAHIIDEMNTRGCADIGGGAAPAFLVMVAPSLIMRELCAGFQIGAVVDIPHPVEIDDVMRGRITAAKATAITVEWENRTVATYEPATLAGMLA